MGVPEIGTKNWNSQPGVIRQRANVYHFFPDEFKHALGVHQKIDRRLVHVKDVTPVVIAAEDNLVHESHEIDSFTLKIGWRALRCVCAHLIFVRSLNGHSRIASQHCIAL